jgi:hypothetical protein
MEGLQAISFFRSGVSNDTLYTAFQAPDAFAWIMQNTRTDMTGTGPGSLMPSPNVTIVDLQSTVFFAQDTIDLMQLTNPGMLVVALDAVPNSIDLTTFMNTSWPLLETLVLNHTAFVTAYNIATFPLGNFPSLRRLSMVGSEVTGVVPQSLCAIEDCDFSGIGTCVEWVDSSSVGCCNVGLCSPPYPLDPFTCVNNSLSSINNKQCDAAYWIYNQSITPSYSCQNSPHTYVLGLIDSYLPGDYCGTSTVNTQVRCNGDFDAAAIEGSFYFPSTITPTGASNDVVSITVTSDNPIPTLAYLNCLASLQFFTMYQCSAVDAPTASQLQAASGLFFLGAIQTQFVYPPTNFANSIKTLTHYYMNEIVYGDGTTQLTIDNFLLGSTVHSYLRRWTNPVWWMNQVSGATSLYLIEMNFSNPYDISGFQQGYFLNLQRFSMQGSSPVVGVIPRWMCALELCDFSDTTTCALIPGCCNQPNICL